ncbi:MAG: hypothetical protein AAB784_02815 [Patescibacteria group bacterium]
METKTEIPALWEILYQADYRDGDGDLSLADTRFYVLSKGHAEALKKAEPLLKNCRKNHHKNISVIASLITLENLMPTRNSENDGRLGWISSHRLSEIKLSLDEDKQRFRLEVCILPVD